MRGPPWWRPSSSTASGGSLAAASSLVRMLTLRFQPCPALPLHQRKAWEQAKPKRFAIESGLLLLLLAMWKGLLLSHTVLLPLRRRAQEQYHKKQSLGCSDAETLTRGRTSS